MVWGEDGNEEKEGRRVLKGHLSANPYKEPSHSISLN
jgi:hypothetical protein